MDISCRVCGKRLFDEPLLVYKNMPKVAQYFPDDKTVDGDMGEDLEIFQCSGCGLVQLNSEPVPYYREVVRANGVSLEMTEFRIKQFKEFVGKFNLVNKNIVEVGCGKGESMSTVEPLGVNVYGLEDSQESVDLCKKNNLKAIKGFIDSDQYRINGFNFDAFYILNFLEHLPDPNVILTGIYNNLTVDGVGIVEVPNFDMILKKNLFSEFTRDHLFYFTKETLISLLEVNGFELLSCEPVWHDYIISAVVRKRSRMRIDHFYENQRKLKEEVDLFLGKYKKEKVAIWGAGHQALAVMAMLELAKKIKYVVDSAPFKQGKYTPATHIPIVSPDNLDTDPVDAVIVMAASYSDEVAGIIRRKYGNKIDISILRETGLVKYPFSGVVFLSEGGK